MQRQRGGATLKILLALLLGGAVFYGIVLALDPWAFHIGGRWTPLLTWQGSGRLHTQSGIEYPLYIMFYPSSHFSRLHMDGMRPTGGLQGSGWLCTSPGVTQRLELGGTIYGGWRSTEGSLMAFRLLEPKVFDVGQHQGYFDLAGRWQGPQLAMHDRSGMEVVFRSGVKIKPASVTFDWGTFSDFKATCAAATNLPAH